MLSCHWYLIWSIWNNPKNISKRRFQGYRRETCRRASPPENVQILQQDIMGKRQSCKNWRNKIIWFVTAISPHNWCQTQILHPKRRARLFQICYKYISGGKTYLGCFLVSLPWYTMIYSWVNLVCPRIEGGYFSAISGQKFYLTTVLRSCWPLEWRMRDFITSECLKKTCFSDFIQIGPLRYHASIWVRLLKQFILDTLKLCNSSYTILEVITVSKQLPD